LGTLAAAFFWIVIAELIFAGSSITGGIALFTGFLVIGVGASLFERRVVPQRATAGIVCPVCQHQDIRRT
jgi:hypothetical protein